MIKNRLLVLIVFLLFTFIVITLASFPVIQAYFGAWAAAQGLFGSLTAGDFDRAFDYVAYFDEASDLEPAISAGEARKIWMERVNNLREQGVYIRSYNDLRIRIDDGYPRGIVTLSIVDGGKETVLKDIQVHFFKTGGRWKVQSLYSGTEQLDLEKTISGYIPLTNN